MTDSKAAKRHGPGARFWVVQQHQDVEVHEGSEPPDLTVEKGERLKVLHGVYKTREQAKARADKIKAGTTKARLERAG
jgi:hypothetical protein